MHKSKSREREKQYLGVRGKKIETILQAPLAGGGKRFGSEGVMSLVKMGFRGNPLPLTR